MRTATSRPTASFSRLSGRDCSSALETGTSVVVLAIAPTPKFAPNMQFWGGQTGQRNGTGLYSFGAVPKDRCFLHNRPEMLSVVRMCFSSRMVHLNAQQIPGTKLGLRRAQDGTDYCFARAGCPAHHAAGCDRCSA